MKFSKYQAKNMQYCLAYCGHNCLGLITSPDREWTTYPDGNTKRTWRGIHLTDKKYTPGSTWTSQDPKVVGRLEPSAARELVSAMKRIVEV